MSLPAGKLSEECILQVYYNPDNTVLRGRPETWLRGGWNRWTHARTFPPQPMQPVQPGGTGFLQGTVEVSILDLSRSLAVTDDTHGKNPEKNITAPCETPAQLRVPQ